MSKKPAKAGVTAPKKKAVSKKNTAKKPTAKKPTAKKPTAKQAAPKKLRISAPPMMQNAPDARILDQLWGTVVMRSEASPNESHSARLLARGTAKVAQKFGEEAVECVIEAVAKNHTALIGESADVLYHLLVLWVDAGLRPEEVWSELKRREGMSGLAEKAARKMVLPGFPTKKIP